MTDIQSAKSWMPVFNWEVFPNFALSHTYDFPEITSQYNVTPALGQELDNLFLGLRGEHHSHNLRIMGAPGCGKTSFVYFLKKILENDPKFIKGGSNYFVHIGHIEGMKEHDKINEDILLEEIKNALADYYNANGLLKITEDISKQDITIKQKIRKMVDYIKHNSKSFKKVMIFILDDVDTATEGQVLRAASLLHSHLEPARLKLWLNIQNLTFFAKYSKEVRTFIKSFYPNRIVFPKIYLYDIIDYRLQNLNKGLIKALNPFSRNLCDTIQNVNFGHLRNSLSDLERLLCYILPKGFSSRELSDIDFIKNYLDKSSYNYFMYAGLLPNVHDPINQPLKHIPIIYEVINIVRHYDEVGNFMVSILNDIIKDKSQRISKLDYTELRIRESDFNQVIKWLKDHDLIEDIGNNRVVFTQKGEVLYNVINTKYYLELCKGVIKTNPEDLYWKFLEKSVNYQDFVINKYDWYRASS